MEDNKKTQELLIGLKEITTLKIEEFKENSNKNEQKESKEFWQGKQKILDFLLEVHDSILEEEKITKKEELKDNLDTNSYLAIMLIRELNKNVLDLKSIENILNHQMAILKDVKENIKNIK